ncbi:hypothetical protein BKA65DRAFT_38553 [Rhexocercosporidium sp. MPI-PUGE-AT-0058]|nr:hypothetical protein BKA65DRAFT_38553 [Rhexocercosporidium sp. MPI-PUGE-AT-0058]
MDEYREILLKKASSSLPNWPKGPNDFYVAILSHEKHVRSCEHKDLLWLKVRGKHTVAQVRAFHNNRVGRKVLLCDGRDVVSDETQIRHLNYQRGEVVVFWTKLDDGRPPLAGLHTAAVNSRSRIDMGAHSVGPSSPAPVSPLPVHQSRANQFK